jgi:hypothetical protein
LSVPDEWKQTVVGQPGPRHVRDCPVVDHDLGVEAGQLRGDQLGRGRVEQVDDVGPVVAACPGLVEMAKWRFERRSSTRA